MRKSGLIEKSQFFLMLFFLISFVSGQEFGRIPLKECWKIENENINQVEIASDNDSIVYLSNSEGFIEAINTQTGEFFWKSEIGGEILPKIISDSSRVFIPSRRLSSEKTGSLNSDKITIHSLSKSTGITNWQRHLSLPEAPSHTGEVFMLDNPYKLFLITQSGNFITLSKQNGDILLEKKYVSPITTIPFLQGEKIYFGTRERKIKTYSIPTGHLSDVMSVPEIPKSILINKDSNLFVGDTAGNILLLDTRNQTVRWKTWTGAEVANVTKVKQGFLIVSLDNYIYLLSEKNGGRIWKKRLSGRSIGNPLIKENIAVFSTYGGSDAVLIELKRGKQINQLNVEEDNYFTNNPKGFGDLVFFQTRRGLFTYTAGSNCSSKK